VWDGGTARQLGLVDGFGGMEEAIAKAAELAKLDEDNRGVRYLERPQSLTDSLLAMLAKDDLDDGTVPTDGFAIIGGSPANELAAAIGDLRSILSGPRIQARCLECGPVAPAALSRSDKGLLTLLTEWF
jgi:protease-4